MNTLYNSDSIKDTTHRFFIQNDLKNWKEEIEIINLEIIFYKSLFNFHFTDDQSLYEKDYKFLLEELDENQNLNITFQKNIIRYFNQLEDIKECDDISCETYYFETHYQFKTEIELFFSKFKNFKKVLFSYLKIKYTH